MDRREAIQRTALILGYAVSAPALSAILEGCKPTPGLTYKPEFFNEEQAGIVSELAEIILPKTDTPGAKDVGVPGFIDKILKECYKKADQDRFLSGLQKFNEAAKADSGDAFLDLDAEAREAYVRKVHQGAVDETKKFESIRASLVGKEYIEPFITEIATQYGAPEVASTANNDPWMAYFPKGNFHLTLDKSGKTVATVAMAGAPAFIMMTKELTLLGFFTSEVGATQVLHYEAVPGAYKGCVPLSEVGKTWAT